MRKTCLGREDRSGAVKIRARRAARARAAFALLILLLPTAAVAASGCGGDSRVSAAASTTSATGAAGSPSPSSTPRSGGTLRYPLQYDVNTMLPFSLFYSPEATHQVFEGLVAYETGADGVVSTVPGLAESWEANADATVWTFHLRRGVRFQQPVGREVTAADVVADFRYTATAQNHTDIAYMDAVIAGTDDKSGTLPARRIHRLGVQAVGRYTVRFTLKHPFAAFPSTLGGPYAWVWPVDYLKQVGRKGFERRPVGTGPFVVSRRVRGRYVDLVRNPSWWNAASGQPYLEAVHFEVFGSTTEMLRAFQEGRVDYTWVPQGQVAASRSLPQVTDGEWVPVVLRQQATGYLAFNMDDPVTGGDRGLPLRQAIDAALDRAALVDAVSGGVHIPQTGLVPPVFPGWEDEQPAQAYDPAKAGELYVQAGSPSVTLVYSRDRLGASVARYTQRACAAAGIPVRLRAISWDRWVKVFEQGRLPPVYAFGWSADYPDYGSFLNELFTSSLSSYTSGTHYSDPDVDRLLTLARSSADPEKRLDLSRRAAHEILADLPVLPLFEYADYRLLSSRVHGFTAVPTYGVDAWKLWVE